MEACHVFYELKEPNNTAISIYLKIVHLWVCTKNSIVKHVGEKTHRRPSNLGVTATASEGLKVFDEANIGERNMKRIEGEGEGSNDEGEQIGGGRRR